MRTLIPIPIRTLTHSRIHILTHILFHILTLCHHLYLNPYPNPFSTPYPNSCLTPKLYANSESVSSALTMTLTLICIHYLLQGACSIDSRKLKTHSFPRPRPQSSPSHPTDPGPLPPTATLDPGLVDLHQLTPRLKQS